MPFVSLIHRFRGTLLPWCFVIALVVVGPADAAGGQGRYAPTVQSGPALTVRMPELREALRCTSDLRTARRSPVLLVPGTGNTSDGQYGSSWQPALSERGIPWCGLTPPHRSLGDIQVVGEYLVRAIRLMNRQSGRKIVILGHSQGGMSMRWALRFWPGVRNMVDDVISLAGDNHGSKWQVAANVTACATACPPVNFQQAVGSNFLAALNSRAETFRSISYTQIYTENDEIVHNSPPDCSSCLKTGKGRITNISVQKICPEDKSDHVMLASDLVAFRLVMDALNHRGPARPARVSRTVCDNLDDRMVNPLTARADPNASKDLSGLLPVICGQPCDTIGAPYVTAEPALKRYVFIRKGKRQNR